MIINLPNNGIIDTNNITAGFEDIVKQSFAGFTYGTRVEYMYQDKLMYIDSLRKKIYSTRSVSELIKERFEFELDEYGEIMDTDEFYTEEFMEQCFDWGFMPLYSNDYGKRGSAKAMRVVLDIIKIVVNYEPPKGE